ncbi:hypothetical protein BY996DRAFT_6557079 [Phakopsora pachyrhizi]|uniref:Uncharacterized protein n=1 Tax=Phakopsora pachyrhizi TaxID=170000 RepID=A0AAV0BF13_PHAPC|nr:hypothetical protein BY996DRAFT_6557079 [Phakopsora pachyrhizi]CAH7684981.1 hypothetical protein PPACK8108_LOCUS19438 [Phakopsora pachyrhizi]
MTVLIDVKLEDPLIKDKRVSLLGGVICGQKISMGGRGQNEEAKNSDCITGSSNGDTTRKNLWIYSNQMKKELKRFMSQCQCLDMTVLVDNKLEDPLIKNKKAVLSEDQFQWVGVTQGMIYGQSSYHGVSKWMEEARTDRLDYDLRRWEPEEYEYLQSLSCLSIVNQR